MGVILPCLALVEAGLSSVNRFHSTDKYTSNEVMVVYRSIQNKCTELVNPMTMGLCPEEILLTMHVCPIKKLEMLRRNLMRLTKSLTELEELNANTIKNHEKSSQLMTFRRNQGTSYN